MLNSNNLRSLEKLGFSVKYVRGEHVARRDGMAIDLDQMENLAAHSEVPHDAVDLTVWVYAEWSNLRQATGLLPEIVEFETPGCGVCSGIGVWFSLPGHKMAHRATEDCLKPYETRDKTAMPPSELRQILAEIESRGYSCREFRPARWYAKTLVGVYSADGALVAQAPVEWCWSQANEANGAAALQLLRELENKGGFPNPPAEGFAFCREYGGQKPKYIRWEGDSEVVLEPSEDGCWVSVFDSPGYLVRRADPADWRAVLTARNSGQGERGED